MKKNAKTIIILFSMLMSFENYNINQELREYLYKSASIFGTLIFAPLFIKALEPYIRAFNNKRELLNNLKIIYPNINHYNFDLIVGYDDIKYILRKKIKILKKQKNKKTKINGTLLYGPPGNGKTKFVISLASEAGVPIILLNINNIVANKEYILENFDTIFNKAQEMSPCILFIDEIDLLIKNRMQYQLTEMQDNILTMILQKLDGLLDVKKNEGVFIVGCTNNINFIDEAMYRPGRLGQKIFIGFPSQKDIKKIFIKRFVYYNQYKDYLLSNLLYEKMHKNNISVASILEYIKDLTDEIEENRKKNPNEKDDHNTISDIIINLNKEFGIH